jgi:hypothetical protein
MTLAELKSALPKHLQTAATPELLDQINQLQVDPEAAEIIRNSFISYSSVLSEGKFKTQDYLNAVQYVSYKLMGYTNKDAYSKTFPVRWQTLALKGASDKDISAYVAAYHKNQLVGKILQQSLIPSWVLNQDAYQRAINVQADLMLTAASEKVRCEAANSLLTHLKPPEVKKVEIDMGVKDSGGISELRATLRQLADGQIRAIEGGAGAREVARIPVIQGELVDAEFSEVEVKS